MDTIDFKIVPVFKQSKAVCRRFADIEVDCDIIHLGDMALRWHSQIVKDYHDEWRQEKHSFAFAAYHNTDVLGFSKGYLLGETLYLSNLYVLPQYQGYGIGAALLKQTETALSLVFSGISLFPLPNAINFYEQYGYIYSKADNMMFKDLPTIPTGVIPVFQWCDKLTDKLIEKTNIDFKTLKRCKHRPIFVYVNQDYKIDGIAMRLPNGKRDIRLNANYPEQILRYRGLELSYALDNCR